VELEIVDISEPEEYSLEDQKRWALQYLMDSYDEKTAKSHKEDMRGKIITWMKDNCPQDEDGNYIWEFDKPVIYDENTLVSGFMYKRNVIESVNEDKAWELADTHDPDRCIRNIAEVDVDELFAMHSEGIISDEDIESVFDQSESYSLVRMEV
jgi:hypothetical protein